MPNLQATESSVLAAFLDISDQLRGQSKVLEDMQATFLKSAEDYEKRFEALENHIFAIHNRLARLEQQQLRAAVENSHVKGAANQGFTNSQYPSSSININGPYRNMDQNPEWGHLARTVNRSTSDKAFFKYDNLKAKVREYFDPEFSDDDFLTFKKTARSACNSLREICRQEFGLSTQSNWHEVPEASRNFYATQLEHATCDKFPLELFSGAWAAKDIISREWNREKRNNRNRESRIQKAKNKNQMQDASMLTTSSPAMDNLFQTNCGAITADVPYLDPPGQVGFQSSASTKSSGPPPTTTVPTSPAQLQISFDMSDSEDEQETSTTYGMRRARKTQKSHPMADLKGKSAVVQKTASAVGKVAFCQIFATS